MSAQQDGKRKSKLGWWAGIAVLLAYVGWMIGPYVRSVVVRDAAITSWIHVATSPIYGVVDTTLPELGQRVGDSGRIVGIRNDRADRSGVESAEAEVARAEAVVTELRGRQESLQRLRYRTADHRNALCRSDAAHAGSRDRRGTARARLDRATSGAHAPDG
jgi:hypothetical protein